MDSYSLLLKKVHEIYDLSRIARLLNWDKEVNMPAGGLEGRAQQISTINRIQHELIISNEMGDLINRAEEEVVNYAYDSNEASLIRCLKRSHAKAKKLTVDFVMRENELSSRARAAWGKARQESDYQYFMPFMQEVIHACREKAELYGYEDVPYDALLDNYEAGAKTKEVALILSNLKKDLVPFLEMIMASKSLVDDSFLYRSYPVEKQKEFAIHISKSIGYDYNRGHLGTVVHPFCTNFGKNDVRITTRWNENFINAGLFGVLHESGHGLYEQGMDDSLKRTDLCSATSLGVHESQSRMNENMVGRSLGFWQKHFDTLKGYFPKQLSDVDSMAFYRGINKVKSSYIRVEADELSYNLHILLRFELEQDMLNGKLDAKNLPEAWNEKMFKYLGLKVDKDKDGCLQDVHWSRPGFGYFPTYTLGNLYAAQFMEAATAQKREINEDLKKGENNSLLNWLRVNIHCHGKKFTPKELILKVTGKPLTHEPFMKYVRKKYSLIYDI